MNRQIVAIIQARMGSSRLPQKSLIEIEGTPILKHIIERLNAVEGIDNIVVATSDNTIDDAIAIFCQQHEMPCVRGSEDNVLSRFEKAASLFPSEIYIRATGDNPMIDVGLIKDMLLFFKKNSLTYSCYKGFPVGSGVEIFTRESLAEAVKNADKSYEFEHVTPYMYQKMTNRKVAYYTSPEDDSDIRMTIDTFEDLRFAKEVFGRLYKNNPLFGINDVKKLLRQEPRLSDINSQVHQKKIEE